MIDIEYLDWIFPFIVLAYGVLMQLVLQVPVFQNLAKEQLPEVLQERLQLHRGLSWVCLIFGALWSMQNIWQR